MPKQFIANPSYLAVFSALLCGLISIALLQNGIQITPDGWAYWEGSVSLLNGKGYVYFGGQPITLFPPLFSLYIAGIQKIFGVSGWSLVVAVAVLAGLTSGAWSYLFYSLSNRESAPPYLGILLAAYISMFTSFHYRVLLAETLFLFLLSVVLIAIVQFYPLSERLSTWTFYRFVIVSLLLTLLPLTKNSAIVFVPSLIILLFLTLSRLSSMRSIIPHLLIGLFVSGCWIGIRQLLGQNGSHSLQWGGRYPPLEYARQSISGLATLFIPRTMGNVWAVAVLIIVGVAISLLVYTMFSHGNNKTGSQRILCYILTAMGCAFVGLYTLFNLTNIADPLWGRFLWFLVLSFTGALAAYITWLPKSRMRLFLLSTMLLLTTIQTVRTVNLITQRETDLHQLRVALNQTISVHNIAATTSQGDALMLITPPAYDWIDRGYSEKKKSRKSNQ